MANIIKFDEFVTALSEKLDIQPVSKERLNKHKGFCVRYKNAVEMRTHFETGDVIECATNINGHYTSKMYLYFANADYTSLLGRIAPAMFEKDTAKEGFFFAFDVNANSVDWYDYILLSDIDHNLKNNSSYVIERVYRIPKLSCRDGRTFLTRDFLTSFSLKNTVLIWVRNKSVLEKLDIQPISKERLDKTNVARKLYHVGDIVYCTYRGIVYFYKIEKRTNSWLWLVRIGDKLTKGAKNFATYSVKPDSDIVYEDDKKRAKIGSDGYASVKIYRQETLYVWLGEDVEGYCDN